MKQLWYSFLGVLLRCVLWLRYRVTVKGAECLPKRANGNRPGILFLPNHPALIDPILVFSRLARFAPRPLADERQMSGVLRRTVARLLGMVTIPDVRRDGKKTGDAVKVAMSAIIEALRCGDNILLYPSGRLYRTALEEIGANSAVEQILRALPDVQIVLVRTTGLWGSSFSYGQGREPFLFRELLHGIGVLFANILFFTPRRQVVLEFKAPDDFPRHKEKMVINRYLEAFYNVAARPAVRVPEFFWQGRNPLPIPEVASAQSATLVAAVDPELEQKVYTLLRHSAGFEDETPLEPTQRLAADLGIDSLSLVEVASAIESEFGHPISQMDALVSVNDCLLAASGALPGLEASAGGSGVPAAWVRLQHEAGGDALLRVAEPTESFAHNFLQLARRAPFRAFLADKAGVKTRWQILLGASLLSQRFRALPGKRIGIMLPASPTAFVVWMACLLAGKEPVLFNWTVGNANMRHGLTISQVTHMVTADALLEILGRQGTALDDLPVTWVALEPLARTLGKTEKLRSLLRVILHCTGLRFLSCHDVPEHAAILFTSGSESAPKAVPLTHENIMTNALDVAEVIGVLQKDKLLAMLPPFHSFGLLLGMAMPAASGIPTVYHPSPTEAVPISLLIKRFGVSIAAATPTFLDGILARSTGTDRLNSIRFAFVGAEKCPDHVFESFAACCPQAVLCEGYGITECSPVVAANLPNRVIRGTIGVPMPSVSVAVVAAAGFEGPGPLEPVSPGQQGILLVRGKNVFAGYLGDAPSPFVEYAGHTWYNTGDFVVCAPDGHMTFAGRMKRFVKIAGEMISLPQMETVLQEALLHRPDSPSDGTPLIAVEAVPASEEQGHPTLVAFTPLEISRTEINQLCKSSGLSPLYAVHKVVRLSSIPLLGSGKTDYQSLKKMLMA